MAILVTESIFFALNNRMLRSIEYEVKNVFPTTVMKPRLYIIPPVNFISLSDERPIPLSEVYRTA